MPQTTKQPAIDIAILNRQYQALSARQREEVDWLMGDAPVPFHEWLPRVSPSYRWDWRYLQHIQEALAKVTAGEIKKLMIFVPPRHGKSEMTTIRYPIYRIFREPSTRVIVGCYNKGLAMKFSRKALKLARQVDLHLDKTALEDWDTAEGGGIRSAGVGSGVTGTGANLIVIDDPIKSRAEAESPAYRDNVYSWYTDDIMTRREPDAAIILIQTRWHEDDLAGRILASEDGPNWTVISLPAEAEENDPLGRAVGEALCPERYDLEALHEIKRVLQRSYFALFQQRPQPKQGAFFQREWFKLISVAPVEMVRLVRYWDKAGTEGGGDWSAGVLMGRTKEGLYYVLDVVRGQWSSHARNEIMKQTADLDAEKYGRGRVETWAEQEGGSGGKESGEITIKILAGHRVQVESSTGAKEVRAGPYADQAEGGNVYVLIAPWTKEYIDELVAFPSGRHDDQVDGSSGAFNKLALPSKERRHSALGQATTGGWNPVAA